MTALDKTSSASWKCPQCGSALPCNVPSDLCPKCLLKAGMGTQPGAGPGGTAVLPKPGEQWGHYAISGLLGNGGMGAVYEAEDTENGRRIALKVLRHTLDSPEARERFFREGRLAASINHPNSLYIFATEEIGGTPVIAMELAGGGTLHERVRAQGPLAIGEAVDCMLQIIAGLEAAERVGILHRDIKPSNCFMDADGTVKIGDFGLSISTAIRTEPALTATGAFLGTPGFCSPEQLRGEDLDARSDIYSVGATLFYLLTGHTPFEAKNVVQLLASVLEQRAPSPKKFRSNIPQGLAKTVLRCLQKQPGERFKGYEKVRQALTPYSSTAPTPATLGLRFLAGVLDLLVLQVVCLCLLLLGGGNLMDLLNLASQGSPKALALVLASFSGAVLYYALLEGGCGAAVGKAMCRLRVVRLDNNSRPGFARASLRAAIYVLLPVLPFWIVYGGDPKAYLSGSMMTQQLMGFSCYFVLVLLFCTVRRRNGFGAVQDLLTKTRVVSRVAVASRPVLVASEMPPPAVDAAPVVGPYHVLETLGKSAGGEWLLGYDLRLLRKVWIHVVGPGRPPVPATLRNIGRVGRLRWLTGRRSTEENWDAFEAASGKPLVRLAQTRQPWGQVRYWLYDLAQEVSVGEKDGTLPSVLALDRVWITDDGRAKLLDFPAPGLEQTLGPGGELPLVATAECFNRDSASVVNGKAQCFLSEVAAAALEGRVVAISRTGDAVTVPLPLHARIFLKSLRQLRDADAAAGALKPLLQRVAEVSRLRRAAVVAGCLALPLFVCLSAIFGMRFLDQSNPGLMELNMLLNQRTGMNSRWAKNQPQPTDYQFAIYIAHHYRAVVTHEATWSGAFALALIKGDDRRFAEQSVVKNPVPTGKEIADADAALKWNQSTFEGLSFIKQPWFPLLAVAASLAFYVGIPALLAAVVFRGGLVLLIAGVTFVRRDGARASRLRMLWRGLVAWSPLLLGLVLAGLLNARFGLFATALVSSLLICGLAILSVALSKRGLPDRLAGTWPVAR